MDDDHTLVSEPATRAAERTADQGLWQQLGQLLGALRAAPVARTLGSLAVLIVIIIALTAYAQIRLNRWNKPFYDAISRRDVSDFMVQLGVFAVIVGVLLVLNVGQRWLVETLKWRMRQALVQDLIGRWMEPRKAFWLAGSGAMGVNPDQRMHDDALKLCDLSADLGVGLLQASILFGSFAGVLWVISEDFSFRLGGHDHAVPGFMLWAAILYASIGSLLSYWVGRSLIARNAQRYAYEGELRAALTRINEHLDGISLAGGEADEKRRVEVHLGDVLKATARLVTGLTNLTWVTAGFGWTTNIAPTLVAAPLYFSGKISFGGLMMAAAAFTQAQSSLRWFVDNFSIIADWRATLLRVAGLRQALTAKGEPQLFGSHIRYVEGEPGCFVIDQLEVLYASGHDRLDTSPITVRPGERLLILGTPGTEKTLLFRALAGLWTWGSGEVRLPREDGVHYVPRGTPYLPRGTLREVLAYPHDPARYTHEAVEHALRRLELNRLLPLLDTICRWDRELSIDEQLMLAFARIVLQSPRWVLMDETLGALDEEALDRVSRLFSSELVQIGLIHIGGARQAREQLFSQVVHLVKVPPPGDDERPVNGKQ